jgi:hypothetical protein
MWIRAQSETEVTTLSPIAENSPSTSSASSTDRPSHRRSRSLFSRKPKIAPSKEHHSDRSAAPSLPKSASTASQSTHSLASPRSNQGSLRSSLQRSSTISAGARDLDTKHAESDDDGDETECDNLFTVAPTLQAYFDGLLPAVRVEDRQECKTIFYLETPSETTVNQAKPKMSKEEKAQHEKHCYAQRLLRTIVYAALGDATKKNNLYRDEILKMRQKLQDCDAKAKQESGAVVINLEGEKSKLQEQIGTLTTEKSTLEGQIESDKTSMQSITKKYNYCLGLALSITTASLLFARYAFTKNRAAQMATV